MLGTPVPLTPPTAPSALVMFPGEIAKVSCLNLSNIFPRPLAICRVRCFSPALAEEIKSITRSTRCCTCLASIFTYSESQITATLSKNTAENVTIVCVKMGTPIIASRTSGSSRTRFSVAMAEETAMLAASLRSVEKGIPGEMARRARELSWNLAKWWCKTTPLEG